MKRRLTLKRLADILAACHGDLTEKALRASGVSASGVRYVVAVLDDLGLTTRAGSRKQRVLTTTLAEAIARVGDRELPPPRECRYYRRHACPIVRELRLDYDPGDIFTPCARFPADQVLPRIWRKDDPDQWYIGTRFTEITPGKPRQSYIYDGDRVRPL